MSDATLAEPAAAPTEPDEIAVAGRKVVDLTAACAAAPDDAATGQAADDALRELERLLTPPP
jgi:hypothetical protein